MNKAVMLSIRPKWCEKIISGEKTIEVRKTRPKLNPPFKCYIYCTSGRPDLNIPISPERLMQDYLDTGSMKSLNCPLGNGKVIGEFVCDTYVTDKTFGHDALFNAAAYMNESDVVAYSAGYPIYGWHISGLLIYDQPLELSEFTGLRTFKGGFELREIDRPPQSWCYVEAMKDGY